MERDFTTITVRKELRDRLAKRARWDKSLPKVIEELLDAADACTCEANRERLGKVHRRDHVMTAV